MATRDFEFYPEQVQILAYTFWEQVSPQRDDCWEWTGRVNQDGYGWLCALGKTFLAHRVSYFLANGYWAQPQVRHLCHNRRCVNPGHLIQGTSKQNWEDRKAMLAGIDLLKAEASA